MKRLALILWCLLPLLAAAHVGSPNVFFEGPAGPYAVRVIIRPPAVLPGIAQIDVRAEGANAVTVQPAMWETGTNGAPSPVAATAVAGETNLFNAAVWLHYSGSYSVHVRVSGNLGGGTAVVPLSSAALRQPGMSWPVAASLTVLGLALFAGAAGLAGAAARDSLIEPGATPSPADRWRGRWVAAGTAVLLAAALHAGSVRWRRMDGEFRNNALYKPVPVLATVRTNANLRLLHLAPAAATTSLAPSWDTLVADHGKLMHLFLIRRPDLAAFAHLHPVRRDAQSFENVLPPLPAGDYQLYAEVTHENGLNQTLTAHVSLPEPLGRVPQMALTSNMLDVLCQSPLAGATNAGQPLALDADDSWHSSLGAAPSGASQSGISRLMGGLSMVFQNANELVENRETTLRFRILGADGQPALLQPYMGMLGHAVVRRDDGEVFTHLHPVGSISMAAQELFVRREGMAGATATTTNVPSAASEVSFPYAFPRSGAYRLWVQVRTGGRVLTGVFDVKVNPAQ
jgi:hypothetical protein